MRIHASNSGASRMKRLVPKYSNELQEEIWTAFSLEVIASKMLNNVLWSSDG